MAVIGHKLFGAGLFLAFTQLSLVPLRADDASDIHRVISNIAESLSDGNAALAITSFSKSCVDYSRLQADFDALASAYDVISQIDFNDDEISGTHAEISVHWTLTLSVRDTGLASNRDADVTIKLQRESKSWRIVAINPITIFDPQENSSRKQ